MTLKNIVEGFTKKNEWSLEEKKAALAMIGQYNEYGKYLRREKNLMEIAETFARIAESAEKFTMNETDDWFDKATVGRNMKELARCSTDFRKLAQESHLTEQRMEALYEDMGHVLSRYFEVKDGAVAAPVAGKTPKKSSGGDTDVATSLQEKKK